MIIVMIGGKARVGKTTLANIIAEYCVNNNLTPRMVPFAYGIKKAAEAKGLSKDTNPNEYRKFCQTLGESTRIKNPDHWVNEWKLKVEEIAKEEQTALNDQENLDSFKERIILVDDCRYMNEIAAARDYNATTIFIKQGKRKLFEDDGDWRNHPSEEMANSIENNDKNYTDIFKFKIPNDSSLDVFKKHAIKNIPMWLHLLADSDRLQCTCELCKANREGREPDAERVIEELMDILEKALEEEDKRDEGNS
jgi:hypothetical protein